MIEKNEIENDDPANYMKLTPLMRAVAEEDVSILVEMLTLGEYKAILFNKDAKGRTALDWARLCNNPMAIGVLKKAMENDMLKARADIMDSLIDQGLRKREANKAQMDDLFHALKNGDEVTARRILVDNQLFREEIEALKDVFFIDATDRFGYSPIVVAAGMNMVDIVNLLLEMDVNIHHKNVYGHTALTWACSSGHADVARLLLFKGANISHRTNEGRTCLHYACLYAKSGVVQVLFRFLFERFALQRATHSLWKYDPSRWSNNANTLEEFIKMKDNAMKEAADLIPAARDGRIGSSDGCSAVEGEGDGEDDEEDQMTVKFEHDAAVCLPCGPRGFEVPQSSPYDPSTNAANSTNTAKSANSARGDTERNSLGPATDDGDDDDVGPESNTSNISSHSNDDGLQRRGRNEALFEEVSGGKPLTGLVRKALEDNDIFHHEYPASLVEATGWTHETHTLEAAGISSPHTIVAPLTVSAQLGVIGYLFGDALGRIAQWRRDAVHEHSLEMDVPCFLGCGHMGKFESISTHMRDDCVNRSCMCEDCRNLFRSADLKAHQAHQCPKRKMGCPNGWQGCGEFIPFDLVDQHLALRCSRRKVYCRLNCGALVAFAFREEHEATHCKRREIPCDKCNAKMESHTISDHLHNHCPERILRCTVGCGIYLPAKSMPHHENSFCRQPCTWVCGELIGPLAKRRYHEVYICPRRPYQCANGCGLGGLTARQGKEHEKHQCMGRMVTCSFGCGQRVQRRLLAAHTDPWHGDCPERHVQCPSNLVGWRVLLRWDPSSGEGIVMKYKRSKYPHGAPDNAAADGEDLLYIRFPRKQVWLNPWTTEIVFMERVIGQATMNHECGWMAWAALNDHLNEDCKNRSVWLASSTDDNIVDILQDTEDKLGATNELRLKGVDVESLALSAALESGDGTGSVVKLEKSQRLKGKPKAGRLGPAPANMPGATTMMTMTSPAASRSERNGNDDDDDSTITCSINSIGGDSGGIVSPGKVDDAAQHQQPQPASWLFPKAAVSPVKSRQGTEADEDDIDNGRDDETESIASRDNLDAASAMNESYCSFISSIGRRAKRRKKYIGQQVAFKDSVVMAEKREDIDEFLREDETHKHCGSCGKLVDVDVFASHQRSGCNQRLVRCKLGCGSVMTVLQNESHVKDLCPKRLVLCPVCNDSEVAIFAEELDAHKVNVCSGRIVKCRQGCDAVITANEEDDHCVRDCGNRMVTCSCDMVMTASDLATHRVAECADLRILCPQSCEMRLRRDEMDWHCEKLCKNKSKFFNRMVFCPIGCGARIKKKHCLEHVSYHCGRRLSDCPLLCGCHVQFGRLRHHLFFCAQRLICCEPNMVPCETKVGKWFFSLEGDNNMTESEIMAKQGRVGAHSSISSTFASTAAAALKGDDWEVVSSSSQGKIVHFGEDDAVAESLVVKEYVDDVDDAAEDDNWNDDDEEDTNGVDPFDEEAMEKLQLQRRLKRQRREQREARKKKEDEAKLERFHFEQAQKAALLKKAEDDEVWATASVNIDTNRCAYIVNATETRKILPSSIVQDGEIRMLDRLRLGCCKRHGCTLLFAAIRMNEFDLAEYIVDRTGGLDLDIENHSGDTALTLACRLGRFSFVELLVQYGANLNKETATGRTALIEAVRSGCVPIVVFLVASGALVRYKTNKHHRSAEGWAWRLKSSDVLRSLELGGIVQAQTSILFNAIACGQTKKVIELIGDGDPFHPNGERHLYEKMESHVHEARDDHLRAEALKREVEEMSAEIAAATKLEVVAKMEIISAEKKMQDLFGEQDKLFSNIQLSFVRYEKVSSRIHRGDIEELLRMVKFDELTRVALFAVGILNEYIKIDDWMPPLTDTSLEERRKIYSQAHFRRWWPELLKSIRQSAVVVRHLQLFNMDHFIAPVAQPLLARVPQLYRDLVWAFERHKLGASDDMLPIKIKIPQPSSLGEPMDAVKSEDATIESAKSIRAAKRVEEAKASFVVWETKKEKLEKALAEERRKREEEERNAPLRDEDWDSDAEEAGAGQWVKGEWQPIVKKKERWWERAKRSRSKTDHATEKHEHNSNSTKSSGAEATQVIVPAVPDRSQQIDVGVKMAEDASSSVISVDKGNSTGGGEGGGGYKSGFEVFAEGAIVVGDDLEILLKDVNDDELADGITPHHTQFLHTVLCLLRAGALVAKEKTDVQAMKDGVALRGQEMLRLKKKLADAELETKKLNSGRSWREVELVTTTKHARFMITKAKSYRERLRVYRLLNQITPGGHTAISWAAAYGSYEAVDYMLGHGATSGPSAILLHLNASFIQFSYRIYRKLRAAHKAIQKEAVDPHGIFENKENVVKSSEVMKDLEDLKTKRQRVLNKLKYRRGQFRSPIAEALYAAKWEVVNRMHKRKRLHYAGCFTWCHPSPPIPFARSIKVTEAVHRDDIRKISFPELIAMGMNDLAAGRYVEVKGWVGPNDPLDFYGEMQEQMSTLWAKITAKNDSYRAERTRLRLLKRERARQIRDEAELVTAMDKRDFKTCIFLASEGCGSIDYEAPDGTTPLIRAAEEDVGASNHTYLVNDDGRPCLAVEYLLDRERYRPGINVESIVTGYTALMRACMLGRRHVVQALLDRGANVNYINKHNRTALHYAADVGDYESVRILMEREIDPNVKDKDGLTAFDVAESWGYVKVMTKISQIRAGVMGAVTKTRGNVSDYVSCPMGCGAAVLPHEVKGHCAECNYREVDCPLGCGERRLQFREIPEHTISLCVNRLVECRDCLEDYKLCYEHSHMNDLCTHRTVVCAAGCGHKMKWLDQEKHSKQCTWRPSECSMCQMILPLALVHQHQCKECIMRRIPCPLQCKSMVMVKHLEHHKIHICACRPTKCEFCGDTFPHDVLGKHAKKCPSRIDKCPSHCGEMVKSLELAHHLAETCAHRFVPCAMGCALKVREVDMNAHLTKECENRLVRCPLKCVEDDSVSELEQIVCLIVKRDLERHMRFECPERPERCFSCPAKVPAKRLNTHVIKECPMREVNCRMPGCLKTLPLAEREEHERHKCRFRLTPCSQGCGELIQVIRMGKHISNKCKMRYIECPLGCKESLRHYLLDEHMQHECPRKFYMDNAEYGSTVSIESLNGSGKGTGSSRLAAGGGTRRLDNSLSISLPMISRNGPPSLSTLDSHASPLSTSSPLSSLKTGGSLLGSVGAQTSRTTKLPPSPSPLMKKGTRDMSPIRNQSTTRDKYSTQSR